MTMQIIVWAGVLVSLVLCLLLGAYHSLRVKVLGDVIPVLIGQTARVDSHREFSASTVAASISLATVIVAFYELVPALGMWLLWPAITTAFGLALFSVLARRVWIKMSQYEFRPTLHAYLGNEFGSKRLALIASVFTAIGYLTAFAVELTVGSRFLAPLMPTVPAPLLVVGIATIAFLYTGLGGFRTVVVTDRLQMAFIWLLLAALGAYYASIVEQIGLRSAIDRIPAELRVPSWNASLTSFVLGILIMNSLTFIGNMGLWQRIAGSQNPATVSAGLWSSVWSSAVSWSLLALVAVGSFMVVTPVPNENLLVTSLKAMANTTLGLGVIFAVVLGLLGAMLSTASTQLIAVTHTIYEDIFGPFRSAHLRVRALHRREAIVSRAILVISAVISVGVVEILRFVGFSVADLAFAIYGAALGLVPPILMTLFVPREVTVKLSTAATLAVTLGFISCWSVAGYGRLTNTGDFVFLAPIVSSVVATIIMLIGYSIAFMRHHTRIKH